MQCDGHKPSQCTLGSVLRVRSVMGLPLKGKQVHGYANKTNFDTNVFVNTTLIGTYAKCLCVTKAEWEKSRYLDRYD